MSALSVSPNDVVNGGRKREVFVRTSFPWMPPESSVSPSPTFCTKSARRLVSPSFDVFVNTGTIIESAWRWSKSVNVRPSDTVMNPFLKRCLQDTPNAYWFWLLARILELLYASSALSTNSRTLSSAPIPRIVSELFRSSVYVPRAKKSQYSGTKLKPEARKIRSR